MLLANVQQEQTLTITHVLWAMFGLLPEGQIQRPHRHQSVALDLILDCQPCCYTLLGDRLDTWGEILNPPASSGGPATSPSHDQLTRELLLAGVSWISRS